jgi:uncharacterized membrane protein HdeD (DUF308 family)
MSLPSEADSINPRLHELMYLRGCWGWFLALGIALILLGCAAISAQFVVTATLTVIILFGSFLIASGVVQIVNAVLARRWRPFFVYLLGGILHLVVGTLMIERPGRAAEVLTLILAVAFLVGGACRILYVLFERVTGWPWMLLNGIVTFLLGIAIWRQWPEASTWVIGLFVGIDLIFGGWSWVMLALAVRAPAPTAKGTEALAAR